MKVFGVLSDERAFRSRSPAMHTEILRKVGVNGVYVPFRVPPTLLGEAVRGLKALSIAGANVTVPYKEAVVDHLDGLSEEAAVLGAVNTIVLGDDRLEGHNTDAGGFEDALAHAGFDPKGARALLFGTGGAARAVAFALRRSRAKDVLIAGRNTMKTERFADEINGIPASFESLTNGALAVDLLVNATSVSSPQEAPDTADRISRLQLHGCRLVIDLNYGRTDNFWLRSAHRASAGFMDGLPMLAFQARRSFALWTGMDVPAEDFLTALTENS